MILSRIHLITRNKLLSYQNCGTLARNQIKRKNKSTNSSNVIRKDVERHVVCRNECVVDNYLPRLKGSLGYITPLPWQQKLFSFQIRALHNISNVTDSKKNRSIKLTETSESEPDLKTLSKITFDEPKQDCPKSIYYDESEIPEEFHKLFATPKSKLHNFFAVVAKELQKKSLEISPSYRSVKDAKKSVWLCTYNLKWPEEVKFMAKDDTKAKASYKASLSALVWLKRQNKMTDDTMPILFNKEEVRQISKKTLPTLTLDKETMEKIQTIADVHDQKFVPYLAEISDNKEQREHQNIDIVDPENINFRVTRRQKYISFQQYMAKEKVNLPIAKYKNEFMDLLRTNQVIIVKGEPGCGKSTRVPQYVLEAWAEEAGLSDEPGRIAVTQPRRIAAISLAQRVSNERDEQIGHIVGYQVRLNSKFNPHTGRILYCTTGILLRHLQSDPKLSNFTHVILDEAHERDVNTDLLMNLLRSAVKENSKLKLTVMSATIDTNVFSEYFGGVPVMEIPGFTFPVKQHFLDDFGFDVSKTLKMCETNQPAIVHEDVTKVIRYIHQTKPEGAILCFLPGWEDITKVYNMIPAGGSIATYCLHSRLQDSEQWKIFSKPPPGIRKIILATNIAETSVTIDDVVYVVDSGIQKEQRFDSDKGINCIDNHWISKASTTQRKGRAGRVQPGESYHLYPRSRYESFLEYTLPEIMRTSLTKIVLDSKVLNTDMKALEFMGKLLTPPEENTVLSAVQELQDLELLDEDEKPTTLGRTLATFQLEPKLSKAMVNSVVFKCVTPLIDIVTLFSSETEYFVSGLIDKEGVKQIKNQFSSTSDHLAMMRVFEKWLEIDSSGDSDTIKRFCESTNLVPHKMKTIEKLREMHFGYLFKGLCDVIPVADDYSDNDELIKAVLFSGVGNILVHRDWDIVKNRFKKNTNVLITRNKHKATIGSESVNFKRNKYPTSFLLYINETRSNIRRTTIVRECSLIPEISVILFSNKKLHIKEIDGDISSDISNKDKVKLVLEDTSIQLICDKEQAEHILKCKNALNSFRNYYIKQLTSSGERNTEINQIWDTVLELLDEILMKNKISERS